jgi:hypothetical protein
MYSSPNTFLIIKTKKDETFGHGERRRKRKIRKRFLWTNPKGK